MNDNNPILGREQVPNQLEPWHELSGKVVLVTGASSGIGRELCVDLCSAGCRVIAAARRVDRLKSLCDQINSMGCTEARALPLELDVSADAVTIETSIKKAWNMFGRIDGLINNAGIRGTAKTSLDLSEEEWNRVFKTNITGSWLVSKYVCILMRDAKCGGSVINISTIVGTQRGIQSRGVAYASSKAAMNTMSRMMAIELGEHKIRVNSIAPGLFRSEITESLMEKPWLKENAERIVPLRDFGSVNPALTSLVRYLIHDSSDYVSGNIYIVDAGTSLPGVPIFSSL